ncbi:MAG TPA: GNAT family N-acetyltransferase [Candidatus Limnocylindrales bacterium]|nr:GNAT family N-acetyltransferase [Candidatus Limnocylindrales bacterium]
MAAPPVALRMATSVDVPALERVMLATETPPPGEPETPPGAQEPYLAHLVARGHVMLAELGGAVAGFGATVDTGRAIHLADLFVLPELHGRGIGGRLLAAVFGDAPRRTTFASDDPRALPLYVRAGMRALWPCLYVAGDPGRVAAAPAEYAAEEIGLSLMGRLERGWTGVDREPDLPYWASIPEAQAFAVERAGVPVATGLWRRRIRGVGHWLDHLQVAPAADPLPALLAAFRYGARLGERGGGCVPGPSPIVGPLLEAGFRVVDRDTFMASDPRVVDPEREIVNTGML